MRRKTGATIAAVGLALFAAAAASAAPGEGNGRQTNSYTCISGPLSGQTVDVSNAPGQAEGAAGFLNGTVYVVESVTVTVAGAGVVHQHDYGQRNGAGPASECIAQEGPATVDVVVVPVGQAA